MNTNDPTSRALSLAPTVQYRQCQLRRQFDYDGVTRRDANMTSNLDRYENEINNLVKRAAALSVVMHKETSSSDKLKVVGLDEEEVKKIHSFASSYEQWYSEALALISQLLPDRKDDFQAFYRPRIARKEINSSNYTISDYLRGIETSRGYEKLTRTNAALMPMLQQLNIVEGLRNRIKSSLFDIKALVRADLLDDELEAAQELNSKGYERGAGAIAGVALESHLGEICTRRKINLKKKDPSISDLNDALKAASVIEVPTWRFIQHLGDLRNKCDHKKLMAPTKEEITELIDGVRKVTKTVF
jgi:hypothetical protein